MEQIAVYKRYSETIPDEMVFMIIDYLIHRKVNYIVAPYEADSQLAYLYHNECVDFIISEDSDMIAYNCFQLIKKFRVNGECLIMDVKCRKQATKNGLLWHFMKVSELKRAQKPQAHLRHDRLRLHGQL